MTTETEAEPEGTPVAPAAPAADSVAPERTSEFGIIAWHAAERAARWMGRLLTRPRVRTFLVGAVLILAAVLFVGHSFWTAPIVVIGILMIVIAWVGSRLEGRFAIEWSEFGTGFEMHARFKSATATGQQLGHVEAPAAGAKLGAGPTDDDDVIDGEAHTIDIPIEELRALVAAAEHLTPVAHREDSANGTATVHERAEEL